MTTACIKSGLRLSTIAMGCLILLTGCPLRLNMHVEDMTVREIAFQPAIEPAVEVVETIP
jgi:hypothetical protein